MLAVRSKQASFISNEISERDLPADIFVKHEWLKNGWGDKGTSELVTNRKHRNPTITECNNYAALWSDTSVLARDSDPIGGVTKKPWFIEPGGNCVSPASLTMDKQAKHFLTMSHYSCLILACSFLPRAQLTAPFFSLLASFLFFFSVDVFVFCIRVVRWQSI